MFRVAHSEYLWVFVALALCVIVFAFYMRWLKRSVSQLAHVKHIKLVIPQLSKNAKRMRFLWFFLGMTFLILGLANPQIGSKLHETTHEGIDIVLAIDVSNSMLAEDIKPSRLERTRLGIEKLIDQLQGDRLGIVVFAGQAFVQLPLTTDYAAAKLFTQSLTTTSINEQGTSIGAALDLSLESFDFESPTSKVIIVVTDGEDHEEDAVKMAQIAAEKGVKVYTIGMGSEEGAPIPIYSGRRQIGYKKDANGNTIITKLNQQMLVEIANEGNGTFFRANNGNIGLKDIIAEINTLEKTELDSKIYSDYEDRFYYFLAIGLLFIIFYILWPEKRLKLADRVNLFEVDK
jgi:Ca-activated chloride channel family protein